MMLHLLYMIVHGFHVILLWIYMTLEVGIHMITHLGIHMTTDVGTL